MGSGGATLILFLRVNTQQVVLFSHVLSTFKQHRSSIFNRISTPPADTAILPALRAEPRLALGYPRVNPAACDETSTISVVYSAIRTMARRNLHADREREPLGGRFRSECLPQSTVGARAP